MDPIAAITAEQHGLITARQIEDIGLGYEWLRWAVDDGRLAKKRRGVYIVVGAPRSPYVDIAAATLEAGGNTGASHFAAGYLWGARDVAEAAPELTAFGGRQVRIRGVRVRRTRLEGAEWLTRRYNIATVTAALMIVQIARETTAELGIAIARDLRSRNLVGYLNVLDCIERTGIKVPPALVHYCQRALEVDGHDDSPAANDLGAALLAAGLPAFETQYQVIVEGRVCLLDFAWPDQMVGLEYLGRRDHGPDQLDHDARRRTQLTAIGWRVLDITKAMTQPEVIRWAALALATSRSLSGVWTPESERGRAS